MATFLNENGLIKKSLAELKDEYEALFQEAFGEDIDLSAEGPFGQIIGILSQRDADLWDGAEEIYTSRNPNEAEGTSLDNISAETGVKRLDATATIADDVLLIGDEGTVVPANSQAKQQNASLTYSLLTSTTITKASALQLKLEPNSTFPLSGGEVFSITLDSVLYSYTGIALDTKKIVIDALVSAITAGAFTGTASNEDDDFLVIDGDDANGDAIPDTTFNALNWTATFDLELLASKGEFQADETGINTLPANTLIEIATPVSGWNSVNNPGAGVTGTATETDAELRIRRANTFLTGNGTDEAIRNSILNELDDIQSASVTSNRNYESNIEKVIYDADFVTGNNIDIVVDGSSITTVPFNTNQATTMADLKTQIEADITDAVATIDPLDSDDRTMIIEVTSKSVIVVTTTVTGGASQPNSIVVYSDGDGRPAKSFEAIVQGGTDQDIADKIWETMPSGIQSFGSETVNVTDSEGRTQVIQFSRPLTKYVHVKVQRGFNTEEVYPTDGDDQIKANIITWSNANVGIGDDVIRQRLATPIYEVSGIGDIEIFLDLTDNPGDSPSFTQTNLTILSREFPAFDISRITVENLP
jgi:uncharacterized phage protein gp47/JayE